MMVRLVAMLLAAGLQSAAAQELGDAAMGHQLATTWCSACHVVAPDQAHAMVDGTPTFSAIAAMKSTTVLSLRVFLQTPHGKMPNLQLSRNETDDLISYILSLRKK
ncbi:MAG: hypothetical protein KGJ41_00050 [Rhodospirillales bacterium]|nr:hypothetical protein [Rhodospirillales bacterium]MDE2197381.1 hypothetical protein [Rhodospirillales bacterium]MDE2576851.1 hypothetical protein [Rhodospirillales bacterium]